MAESVGGRNSRKRKLLAAIGNKKQIFPLLRNLAIDAMHPIIFEEIPQASRRNSLPVNRYFCFSGIPFAAFYLVGAGINKIAAEEDAANNFLHFIGQFIGPENAERLRAGWSKYSEEYRLALNVLNGMFSFYSSNIEYDLLRTVGQFEFNILPEIDLLSKKLRSTWGNTNYTGGGETQIPVDVANPEKAAEVIEVSSSSSSEDGSGIQCIKVVQRDNNPVERPPAKSFGEAWDSNLGESWRSNVSAIFANGAQGISVAGNMNNVPKTEGSDVAGPSSANTVPETVVHDVPKSLPTIDQQDSYITLGDSDVEIIENEEANSKDVSQKKYYSDASDDDDNDDPIAAKRQKLDDVEVVLNVSSEKNEPDDNKTSDDNQPYLMKINGSVVPNDAPTNNELTVVANTEEQPEADSAEKEELKTAGKRTFLRIAGPKHEEMFENENRYKMTTLYNGHISASRWAANSNLAADYEKTLIGVTANLGLARVTEDKVRRAVDRATESVKRLTMESWSHFGSSTQDEQTVATKLYVRDALLAEFNKVIQEKPLSLFIVGSTVNGCGSYNSDIDLCLCYPTNAARGTVPDNYDTARNLALKLLRKIEKSFKRPNYNSTMRQLVRAIEFINARVPIIRVAMQHPYEELDIDVNVNNIAGIYNSHLLHFYSQLDARFPALALLVKHWAIRNNINNAMHGTFNSYSLNLLVVHYLQCGVQPAVLPNLQYLFPDKFDRKVALKDLEMKPGDISYNLNTPTSFVSAQPQRPPNTWTLGELVIGFFTYYANFNFPKHAISIRSACIYPRRDLDDPVDQKNFKIFIEEPFDGYNTARCITKDPQMKAIKQLFKEAADVFSRDVFDLSQIKVLVE